MSLNGGPDPTELDQYDEYLWGLQNPPPVTQNRGAGESPESYYAAAGKSQQDYYNATAAHQVQLQQRKLQRELSAAAVNPVPSPVSQPIYATYAPPSINFQNTPYTYSPYKNQDLYSYVSSGKYTPPATWNF